MNWEFEDFLIWLMVISAGIFIFFMVCLGIYVLPEEDIKKATPLDTKITATVDYEHLNNKNEKTEAVIKILQLKKTTKEIFVVRETLKEGVTIILLQNNGKEVLVPVEDLLEAYNILEFEE